MPLLWNASGKPARPGRGTDRAGIAVAFSDDRPRSCASFEKWIRGLWFAPTELKSIAALGQLNGIYVPHWTYDAMTYARYVGQRGDNYTETESYTDSQGKKQTRSRHAHSLAARCRRGAAFF